MSHKSTKNNLTLWTLQQTWTTSACVGMFCLLWCHFFNYVQIITSLKSVQPRLKLYVNKVNKQMTTNINLTFFHHILLNTQNILIQMISKHRNNRFPFFFKMCTYFSLWEYKGRFICTRNTVFPWAKGAFCLLWCYFLNYFHKLTVPTTTK